MTTDARIVVITFLFALAAMSEGATTNALSHVFFGRYQGAGLYLELHTTNGIPFVGPEGALASNETNAIIYMNVVNGYTNAVFLSLEPSLLSRRGMKQTFYNASGSAVVMGQTGGSWPYIFLEKFVYLAPCERDARTREFHPVDNTVVTLERKLEPLKWPPEATKAEIVLPVDVVYYVNGYSSRHEETVDVRITLFTDRNDRQLRGGGGLTPPHP